MFYAVFTPSNEESTPSLQYNPQGTLSADEAYELERQLVGTMCSVVEFDNKQQYQDHLDEMDEHHFGTFYEPELCYE